MNPKIGVIGSAAQPKQEILRKAEEVGKEIAKSGCILISGASPGVPYKAVEAANSQKGLTVGISPANSLAEHLRKYRFPVSDFDVLIFTGFGLKGRNVIFVRTCDAVVAVSGRVGTLNEFTIAYDEGKTIGVLTNTGGISDEISTIVDVCGKEGGRIIYDLIPARLVRRVVGSLNSGVNTDR